MGIFKAPLSNRAIQGKSLTTFSGCVNLDSKNFLNAKFGQLIYNKNMEYFEEEGSVCIKTKRGSTLIKDISNQAYGASNYVYDDTQQYLTWANADGNLYYLDEATSGINLLTSALTPLQNNAFYMYGQESVASLYGCNAEDGIYKVSGSTPTFSTISDLPTTWICFSNISGRMIGVYKHLVRWTPVQVSDSDLTNLETWDVNNSNPVSPDSGKGFVCCIDDGQITYLFKDTGIWGIANAAQDPDTEWSIPKLKSEVGSTSPKTICLAQYGGRSGIIFLATDKTLRFMTANIDPNSGSYPVIADGIAKVISKPFQSFLNSIPTGSLQNCVGTYSNGKYILCFIDANGVILSRTLVIDTDKLMPKNFSDDLPQPFWFESENMNYSNFVRRETTNILYGFHTDGYISSLFTENSYVEEVPTRIDATGSITIEWQWNLGYQNYLKREAELIELALSWRCEGLWAITLMANSFAVGSGFIPEFDNGSEYTYFPTRGSSYFDVSIFDVAVFSENGQLSQMTGFNAQGDYFTFGAKSTTKESFATFYGIDTYFKSLRRSPISYFS